MNIEEYRKYMTAEILMGPNSLRILEELLEKHPLTLSSDGAVLEKDVDRERKPVNSAPASDNYISADKAKALAYEHAEVKAADVKFSKAELDRDDLIVHYDVEFVVGKFEYEYEINAESGKVVVSDKEFNG